MIKKIPNYYHYAPDKLPIDINIGKSEYEIIDIKFGDSIVLEPNYLIYDMDVCDDNYDDYDMKNTSMRFCLGGFLVSEIRHDSWIFLEKIFGARMLPAFTHGFLTPSSGTVAITFNSELPPDRMPLIKLRYMKQPVSNYQLDILYTGQIVKFVEVYSMPCTYTKYVCDTSKPQIVQYCDMHTVGSLDIDNVNVNRNYVYIGANVIEYYDSMAFIRF